MVLTAVILFAWCVSFEGTFPVDRGETVRVGKLPHLALW